MEFLFRSCLFITGIINILPSILAFIPNKISNSYGIEILNSNYELILRHRAVLFGIVGAIMIYSAMTKRNYLMAAIVGLISMSSFVLLYVITKGEINSELTKIMKIDIAGISILLFGLVMLKFKRDDLKKSTGIN